MIIKTKDRKGRETRVRVNGKIQTETNGGFTCWGHRWIKSQQRFSKVLMIHIFDSYKIEVTAWWGS